jgi:hypothetical protein
MERLNPLVMQSDTPFIDLPYPERRLVVVDSDEAVAAMKQVGFEQHKRDRKQAIAVGTAATLGAVAVAAVIPGLVLPLAGVAWWKRRDIQRAFGADDQSGTIGGLNALRISVSQSRIVTFPSGHPRIGTVYVGHPVINRIYYPAAQFHRFAFEHKVSEAIHLLMALAATYVEVQHVAGWSKEFLGKVDLGLPNDGPQAGVAVNGKAQSSSQALFTATLDGAKRPVLPSDLAWYSNEPTWQEVVRARLEYGLTKFNLVVSYQDDFGVNGRLKAAVAGARLDLGGEFEDYRSTVWQLVGRFGS